VNQQFKIRLEQLVDQYWKLAQNHLYHLMDASIRGRYGDLIKDSSKTEYTLDDFNNEIYPAKRLIIMLAVLLFFGLDVTIPATPNGTSKMNESIWIAVLSFEGAIAVGYITITPLLLRVISRMIPTALLSAVKANVLQLAEDSTIDDLQSELEKASNTESPVFDKLSARFIFNGGLLLVGLTVIIPQAIWLPPNWQVGVLGATVVWVCGLLEPLLLPSVLAFNDPIWKLYALLQREHNTAIHICRQCNSSSEQG